MLVVCWLLVAASSGVPLSGPLSGTPRRASQEPAVGIWRVRFSTLVYGKKLSAQPNGTRAQDCPFPAPERQHADSLASLMMSQLMQMFLRVLEVRNKESVRSGGGGAARDHTEDDHEALDRAALQLRREMLSPYEASAQPSGGACPTEGEAREAWRQLARRAGAELARAADALTPRAPLQRMLDTALADQLSMLCHSYDFCDIQLWHPEWNKYEFEATTASTGHPATRHAIIPPRQPKQKRFKLID